MKYSHLRPSVRQKITVNFFKYLTFLSPNIYAPKLPLESGHILYF